MRPTCHDLGPQPFFSRSVAYGGAEQSTGPVALMALPGEYPPPRWRYNWVSSSASSRSAPSTFVWLALGVEGPFLATGHGEYGGGVPFRVALTLSPPGPSFVGASHRYCMEREEYIIQVCNIITIFLFYSWSYFSCFLFSLAGGCNPPFSLLFNFCFTLLHPFFQGTQMVYMILLPHAFLSSQSPLK